MIKTTITPLLEAQKIIEVSEILKSIPVDHMSFIRVIPFPVETIRYLIDRDIKISELPRNDESVQIVLSWKI